jgi:hypothetical protein
MGGSRAFFARRGAALRSHLAARFGTLSAHVGAPGHLLVTPGHTLAVLSTRFADFGAEAAGALVKGRSADHEVGTGQADLGAIRQQALVIGRGMLAAHPEAVDRCLQAGPVAIKAVLNALLHVHGEVPHVVDAFQTSAISRPFRSRDYL